MCEYVCFLSDHFNTTLNSLRIILACKFMTTMCAVTMQLSEIVKLQCTWPVHVPNKLAT